jgi:undecaprenyl-diphosphatase
MIQGVGFAPTAHLALAGTDPVTTFQAIVLGLLQGVSELFPISSLGHTVLFPTLFGWHTLVASQSKPESFWLAFVVMLHVGSAVGLLIYFWRDWIELIKAFFRTLATRRIETSAERLVWLIIAASIPTGILGLVLEHQVRVALAKPEAAAIFLVVNGFILIGAERLRRRTVPVSVAGTAADTSIVGASRGGRSMESLTFAEAGGIGVIQSSALIAGISRDGVCMTGCLLRGLDNEHAAKFAFLLATPIILAAGLFKLPDLTGPLGDHGVRRAALFAAVAAAVAAVFTVHFLLRYFRNNNLIPFGVYCLLFGVAMIVYNAV